MMMIRFDLHLHWYPGFDLAALWQRLEECEINSPEVTHWVGVVHSTSRVDCWELFLEQCAGDVQPEQWTVENREKQKLCLRRKDASARFVFYPGRQWATAESLELLTIGDKSSLSEYTSLDHWLPSITKSGGVAILPWGFGKWTGGREKIISRWENNLPAGAFWGDSYNRPQWPSGWKGLFHANRPAFDGSDPLPMKGEEKLFFTMGGEWRGDVSNAFADPLGQVLAGDKLWGNADELAGWLTQNAGDIQSFGDHPSCSQAIARQFRLRLKGLPLEKPLPPVKEGVPDLGDVESATDGYARRFSGSVGAYFLSRQSAITSSLIPPASEGAAALDVGGGHAQIAPLLLEAGYDVTILSSSEACRLRPDRVMGKDAYNFQVGNYLSLPYPDKTFDVVTCFRLFPHERQWPLLMRELCRVSKGGVIFDYPDLRSFNIAYRMLFHLKKRLETQTREFALFRRKEILNTLKECGVEDSKFCPQFFFPMVVHRNLKSGNMAASLEKPCQWIGLTQILGSPVIVRASVSKNTFL